MHKINNIKKAHVILTNFLGIFVFIIFTLYPSEIFAQEEPFYDQISVFLEVPRVGGTEIDAVIIGSEIYLPVTNLFDFLKIRNIPDPDPESITGFFINQKAEYSISRTGNKIIYQGTTYDLMPNDLIRTEDNLYLRSFYFGKIFGIDCAFNFRGLSVTVNTQLELPLIKEMKQEAMRKNLSRLKGEVIADSTIGRTYPGFKFGMADWGINASQIINGKSDTRLTLGLGAMVAGGEATASLYYNTDTSFLFKQQQYLWRYVNNDFKPLRQVSVGKIETNAISTIYNPVVGIKLTNTPTTYRRSFGTFTLSDYTDPDWIVELYVNNVLVDYSKADASGFFTFEVPLVYGNTNVTLKYIGPWGEEKTKEQNILVPFTFLPVKTLEYNVSAGVVQDTSNSIFSRATINYGLASFITIGGGAEFLSSVSSGPAMPYLNASLKVSKNILLTSEYTYGIRSKSTLTYRLPSNMQLDVNYTWYHKDQTAIRYSYTEERKAAIAIPVHIGKFSTYQRLSFKQIVMPGSKYSTAEWLFSGTFFKVNTNMTTYALFVSGGDPTIYSNLSLSFNLPAAIVCRPQVQYSYSKQKVLSARIALQKHLFKQAYLDVSVEHNEASKTNMAQLEFRYDFSFAQVGLTATRSNKVTTLSQYARGSFITDVKTKYLKADNRTNVGRGGITVIAFIDSNSNGVKDKGEQKVGGLNLRASGGRVERCERDTTIRILGLEPYTNCFVELDENSFDNISWKLAKQTYNVAVDPEILKLIEIPVTVAGEAAGSVSIIDERGKTGLGRIIVNFYTSKFKRVGRALTEDDGYYSYLGLKPGNYYAIVDSTQLQRLNMQSVPSLQKFEIHSGIDGDVVDGLDFTLNSRPVDTTATAASAVNVANVAKTDTSTHAKTVTAITVTKKVIAEPIITDNKKPETKGETKVVSPRKPEIPVVKKDTSYMIVHEATQELVTVNEDSYSLQLGAFKRKANAEALRDKLRKITGKNVDIIIENNFYKVRITGLKDRKEVNDAMTQLLQNGVKEVWVTNLKAKQQQWILKERQDSVAKITETAEDMAVSIAGPDISVQVGAFRQKNKAIALKKKLESLIDKKITLADEDGYTKVRVSGFTSREEMQNYLPVLRKLGLLDAWILPSKKKEAVRDTAPIPVINEQPDTTRKVIEKVPEPQAKEEPPVIKGPTVALQVGVFYKKHQALRAQKKIESKLDLPVEIIKQWDYYRVVVTGFYSREETYKFYPELAGIGYPIMGIIEQK